MSTTAASKVAAVVPSSLSSAASSAPGGATVTTTTTTTATATATAAHPSKVSRLVRRLYEQTATDPRWDAVFIGGLFLVETLLCFAIIQKVPYTEIDWNAYMQQVETFEQGERDYLQIRGGTGPLVYPAGFLYLFSALRRLCLLVVGGGGGGESSSESKSQEEEMIRTAQYVFAAFYLATQMAVWFIYQQTVTVIRQSRRHSSPSSISSSSQQQQHQLQLELAASHEIWSWRIAMACTCLSKRVHSIFVLRLFNDGPTMLLLYAAMTLFTRHRWNAGCLVFSLAVSLKMNVLLFAPGLLLLLLQVSGNLRQVVSRLLVCCALPQLILGAPFLLTHPVSYLRKAFELDRVFFYQWTVNWKFLPENVFVSKPLSVALLLLHIGGLAYFCKQWLDATQRATGGKRIFLFVEGGGSGTRPSTTMLSPIYITSTLLVSNYIGICFARTLHYQFYSWYFHALPYMLWCQTNATTRTTAAAATTLTRASSLRGGGGGGDDGMSSSSSFSHPIVVRIALLLAIEVAFLTFPATPFSSALLQVAHLAILLQIRPPDLLVPTNEEPVQGARGKGKKE